jgi:CcmD family protein
MNFLFIGTAVVWLGILGYMISLSVRQNQLSRKLKELEQGLNRNG